MSRNFAIPSMLALALLVTACGGDGQDQNAATAAPAAFELSGSGKHKKLTGPSSIKAGLVRLTFNNSTTARGGVQLFRGTAGHSGAQAREAAAAWGEDGKPLPNWVKVEGGTPHVGEGNTSTAVQQLPAGDYMAVDFDSNARTPLKVTPASDGAKLPSTDARIEATEYRFTATGLKAGANTVEFANTGKQPHFFSAVPYKPGATLKQVREYFRTQKGDAPLVEDPDAETISAVLDGGRTQVIQLHLKKGKYALGCFIPDRTGGPPHASKGMISEVTVK
ncbi:MAG: hypothetical protein LC798_20345 [Chloroflexi bacterium]|nr:hypothetical protein [Chloroflexota bacterium]